MERRWNDSGTWFLGRKLPYLLTDATHSQEDLMINDECILVDYDDNVVGEKCQALNITEQAHLLTPAMFAARRP